MIRKYQIGGGSVYSAVLNPIYAQQQAAEEAATTSKATKKQSLVDDDIIKRLDGIPVDVDRLVDHISTLEAREAAGLPVSRSAIADLRKTANRVKQFKVYMEKAEARAEKNDSWADIAVSDSGYVWAVGEKGLQKKLLSDFKYGEEQLLTVSDLVDLRKHNASFAFDQDLIKTIGTSAGSSQIQKYITDIAKSVGESATTNEAYTNVASLVGRATAEKPSQKELEDLRAIYDIIDQAGPDAIFKLKDYAKEANLEAGMSYLARVLPKNMRMQLQAQYMANYGLSFEESNKEVSNTLMSGLEALNNFETKHEVDFDAAANKGFGRGKTDEDLRYQTTLEKFFNRNLDRVPGGVIISDGNYKNRYVLTAPGSQNPSLVTDNGAGVGESPMDIALDQGGHGMLKYLDQNKIWFGTDKANREQLSKVFYTGDQIANVDLPTDGEGNINWDALHNYAAAEEAIKDQNITDIAGKNKIHEEFGSYVRYAQDGSQQFLLPTEQFLMAHGITSDDEISSENTMYREIGRDREDYYNEKISAINKKYKTNLDKGGWFTDIIEVPIFMRIQPNAALDAAYYARQGSQVPKRTLEQDMAYQQTMPSAATMPVQGDASILYQE